MTVSKQLIENIQDLKKSLNEISVYDMNVYSVIELYYNIAKKLNEVITELGRFEGVLSEEIITQNEKLIYLLGEGLNTEVVTKINKMIKDGTIDQIINDKLLSGINSDIKNLGLTKLSKTDVITMSNLGQDVKESMTGGSVAVVGVDSVYNENIVDNQITEEKLKFIDVEKSVNLFNALAIEKGYFINWDGTISTSSELKYASEYIKITPNTNLTIDFGTNTDGVNRILCYDYKKTYLGNANNNSSDRVQTITPLENTYYIRISGNTVRTPNIMIVEGDTLPTNYIPYNKISTLKNIKLDENIVGVENINFINHRTSLNLFDSRKVIDGLGLGQVGEKYIADSTSNTNYKNFKHYLLPCNEGDIFTVTGTSYYYLLLDSNKNVILRGGNSSNNIENVTINTITKTAYIVINFRFSSYPIDSYMIVKGDTLPSNYISYLNEIEFDMDIKNINQENKNNVMYISPSGNDDNNGSKLYPKLTLQTCLNEGCYNIILKEGIYKGQKLYSDKLIDKLKISCEYENVNGNTPKAVIDNSTDLVVNYDSSLNLYICDYEVALNSNWYKVFNDKSLNPIRTGLRSESYNAILWECFNNENDIKLKPILSLDECILNKGSFYYDYLNKKLYINPNNLGGTYKTLINEEGHTLDLSNIKELYLNDIEILFSAERGLNLNNIGNGNINSCIIGYSAYSSNVIPNNSNIDFKNCKSYKACGDGFAPINCGNTNFINCKAYNNYDDGLSHHDGCNGVVIGGEYYNNYKGGIATAHGAEVNSYNVLSYSNGYGFYCQADRNVGRNQILNGCIAYNNNIGLSVLNYHVKTFNCNFETNKSKLNVANNDNTSLLQL